ALGRERVVAIEVSDVDHAPPGEVGKLVTLQGWGLGDPRHPDAAGQVDRVVPEHRRDPGAQFLGVQGRVHGRTRTERRRAHRVSGRSTHTNDAHPTRTEPPPTKATMRTNAMRLAAGKKCSDVSASSTNSRWLR